MVLLLSEACRRWSKLDAKYERHRPEASLLYQVIEQHWPQFQAALERQYTHQPKFFTGEFEEYLKCGGLEAITTYWMFQFFLQPFRLR